MEELKKEFARVGITLDDTMESVIQKLELKWNEMSPEQKEHLIELIIQADLNI